MLTETLPCPPDAAGAPEGEAPVREGAGSVLDLSNDYLNHYSEALMLIELAAFDEAVVEDLGAWAPLTYPAYFAASPLRRAKAALAAYEALAPEPRAAFEELTWAMDTLVRFAILALRQPTEAESAAMVAAETGPTLRRLIERAAAFLNSGGTDLPRSSEVDAAQGAIDRLMEHAGVQA
ncbi:MAG TPA: hypothetical protein VIL65_01040 [Beijerinckiaceae bacterium]